MKKCPYCAEKIQDEAIVCRYCGRNLPQAISPVILTTTSQTPSQQPQSPITKAKRSVWAQGAIVSAVFTVLAAIGIIIHYQNSPAELIGSLTLGIIANFLFWWLVVAGIIWLWSKIGMALIILGVCILAFGSLIYFLFRKTGNTYMMVAPTPTTYYQLQQLFTTPRNTISFQDLVKTMASTPTCSSLAAAFGCGITTSQIAKKNTHSQCTLF